MIYEVYVDGPPGMELHHRNRFLVSAETAEQAELEISVVFPEFAKRGKHTTRLANVVMVNGSVVEANIMPVHGARAR